jgi:hypothetical protein
MTGTPTGRSREYRRLRRLLACCGVIRTSIRLLRTSIALPQFEWAAAPIVCCCVVRRAIAHIDQAAVQLDWATTSRIPSRLGRLSFGSCRRVFRPGLRLRGWDSWSLCRRLLLLYLLLREDCLLLDRGCLASFGVSLEPVCVPARGAADGSYVVVTSR